MDILSVLLRQSSRKIGLIIPDVVISETHTDSIEFTKNPIERPPSSKNSTLNVVLDHCYRQPATLSMKVGFSGGGRYWILPQA